MKLLIVEDNPLLGKNLSTRLGEENYDVLLASSLKDAIDAAERERFGIAVVDIGLPDGSGLALLGRLRQAGTRVILLTAADSAEVRLHGFELGADDFIPKPFHIKELILRLRRLSVVSKELPSKCGLQLDAQSFRVIFQNKEHAQLSPSDFELLRALVEAAPAVLTREEIIEKVWAGEVVSTRTVDNSIVRLRGVLRIGGMDNAIKSVRGIGYNLNFI